MSPLQPYEKLGELMAMADIHLVVQKAGVADLVLPSKLTTILAAGGYSIITADTGTSLGDFCEQHPGIARRVAPEDTAALVAAIAGAVAARQGREGINALAREYAVQHLGRAAVLEKLESDLLALVR